MGCASLRAKQANKQEKQVNVTEVISTAHLKLPQEQIQHRKKLAHEKLDESISRPPRIQPISIPNVA